MGAPFTVWILSGHSVRVTDERDEVAAMARALELCADAQTENRHALVEVFDPSGRLVMGVNSAGHLWSDRRPWSIGATP
jgi:hypothetical protein